MAYVRYFEKRNTHFLIFYLSIPLRRHTYINFSYFSDDVYTGDPFPIPNNTIVVLNPDTGAVSEEWANDLFYMPHMLTVDWQDKVWVTDVGLHQVFKFDPLVSKTKPVLTLGTEVRMGEKCHAHVNEECYFKRLYGTNLRDIKFCPSCLYNLKNFPSSTDLHKT